MSEGPSGRGLSSSHQTGLHGQVAAVRRGGAVLPGVAVIRPFLNLSFFFPPREKLEEKAKLYEKMTKGDFIGKYNYLCIFIFCNSYNSGVFSYLLK